MSYSLIFELHRREEIYLGVKNKRLLHQIQDKYVDKTKNINYCRYKNVLSC